MKKVLVLQLSAILLIALSGCRHMHSLETETEPVLYTAVFTMYMGDGVNDENNSISSSDLTATQKIHDKCLTIMNSRAFLETVIEKSGYALTVEQLSGMLFYEFPDDMQIARVCVASEDSQLSLNIAQTIAEIAPAEISDLIEGASIKIVDMPVVYNDIKEKNRINNGI